MMIAVEKPHEIILSGRLTDIPEITETLKARLSQFGKVRKVLKKPGELLFFSLVIGLINLYFYKDPGFFNILINPYIVLSLIVSSYYGKYYGKYTLKKKKSGLGLFSGKRSRKKK